MSTKIAVYCAVTLPSLLYSSETYTLYRRHIKRLSRVYQRQLRSIMGIRWQDRISNEEVLQRADVISLESVVLRSQLRWTGHVIRMQEDRLPRQTFYGELLTGKRSIGRPLLRFKDTVKRQLKLTNIAPHALENIASQRAEWRRLVSTTANLAEEERRQAALNRRAARHAKASSTNNIDKPFECNVCGFRSASRIGLWSHSRKH